MIKIKFDKAAYAIACVLLLPGYLNVARAQVTLKQAFARPPAQYRPVPFWHLNGALTTGGINKQVNDALKNGFGGVTILPVTHGPQHPTNLPTPGMSPAYLSEAYFQRYADILKAVKTGGGQAILYDDIDFPSGSAGGKLQKDFPNLTRKVLDKKDTVISGGGNIKLRLPKGWLMAAVATPVNGDKRTDLTALAKNGELVWQAPAGEWKISLFNCRPNADALVDFMDPAAVQKFVGFTYDEYAKRFGSYFGNVIKQTFFDDVGYVTMERGWTNAFNQKFKQLYNKDAALYYPALWDDIGPETSAARVAFFDTRAELLAEGFPKVITAWTKKHGLKSSGHPPGNYEIQPVDMNFDIFKFNRYQDIPTMDAIFYHGHGREGFKLVSSAAAVYDRPVVAAEIYGAFFEDKFTVNTLYQAAMEVFARGVNFLVPHGMWYDPDPKSVRIPPLISPYSAKLQPSLNAFNDFAARTSMMLTGGRQVADIGIIYPIASLEAFYHFDAKDNKSVGKYVPPGTDYLAISDMLTNTIHRDFSFIHPQLLVSNKYSIANKQLNLSNKINTQSYKVIIIPGGKVISYHTLKKIREFYQQGGKVIATSVLPQQSAEFNMDNEVKSLVQELFYDKTSGSAGNLQTNTKGGMALFIEDAGAGKLAAALQKMNTSPDVLIEEGFTPKSGNGAFSYLHKIKDGNGIYYFANSTMDSINTVVKIKGKITPKLWDPATGRSHAINAVKYIQVNGSTYTSIALRLAPVSSVFIVGKQTR